MNELTRATAAVLKMDWQCRLLKSKDGAPRALLANAELAFRSAEEMTGVLAFSEFSLDIIATERTPWGSVGRWTENDNTQAAVWLQREYGICVNSAVAAEAALTVARTRAFHPVREYLEGLQWDGTPRINQWLSLYLGVENTLYSRAVGERWLISAVARVFRPGAKVDCCLILEGPQGICKSTSLRTLAGDWFTDELADFGTKDAAMQTRGVWVIEIAELDSMSRSEVGRTKAFMSRSVDRFRPPYGRTLTESPRQCVFAGSVNHSTYLRDKTGGRRFWPVKCSTIRIDDLARDRDQLWAEAVAMYRESRPWWLDSPELNSLAAEQQADRYEGDPWDDIIAPWIANPKRRYEGQSPVEPWSSDDDSVTITDVLIHCVGKRLDQWTQADKNRVARSMQALGWERFRSGARAAREWRYRRAVSQ